MKVGSLIVFEQESQGYDFIHKQGNLFKNDLVRIATGTCGIICKIQEYPDNHLRLAEMLIGNKLIFDINLDQVEYKLLN